MDQAIRNCATCGEAKTEEQFAIDRPGKRKRICKACINARARARGYSARRRAREVAGGEVRWRTLRERYGLSRDQFEELLAAQGRACAICGRPQARNKPLVVDHCHATGVVRALLCRGCNFSLGLFEKRQAMAAKYLAVYGAGNPLLRK